MLYCRTIMTFLVLQALVDFAHSQIVLNADFDHGSLDEANSLALGKMVHLAGRDNFNTGTWKWLYFSAAGVNGLRPTFQIGDNFATGGADLRSHEMIYSYDQDEWFFFDNNARDMAAETYTFSNNSGFEFDTVYVAYGLPYPLGRVASHTASIGASPWVAPTLSGGADLIVGQSPGGVDDIGRTIAPQDLYACRITDSSVSGGKARIVLAAGVHPNETLANYTLEALVNYLLGDELSAALLRRRAEFYIYPLVNPDGRIAGYNRSTVEHPHLDPNRFWDPPSYGGQSEIAAVGEAMIADTDRDVDMFIDFHSTVVAGESHFGIVDVDRNFHLNPFWRRLLELEPTLQTQDAALIDDTTAKFGLSELNARFTMTFETRFIAGENEERFVTLGHHIGRAFADAFAGPLGDLDFDGQLDADDWSILSAHAQTSTAGLPVLDAYALGDLNSDGTNDVFDFGLFKNAFLEANGLHSFARLLAGVPEPTTLAIAMAASLCFAGSQHRHTTLIRRD